MLPDDVTTPTRGLRPPVEDDDLHWHTNEGKTGGNASTNRVPDLSFLSANFSTDSLDVPLGNSPSTPAKTPNGFGLNNLLAPFHNRRYSNNSATPSLTNSPVGQPSNSYHQRAGSNAGARPRPRSMLGSETANYAIWEDDKPPGLDNLARNRHSAYLSSKLTPLGPPLDTRMGRSRSGSPVRSTSPVRRTNRSPYRRGSSPSKEPFNFKLQDIMISHSNSLNLSLVVKPAHRKGHRYKHSSVSMNLFQEPVPIADANLQQNLIPDLYPIPNFRESLTSAGQSQKFKLLLSVAHFVVSVLVFLVGVKCHQPTFSTLAHLVFYDSLGSLVVACVDIASNFEVWNKSSIAYPFGLGRLEVLTGFALSASLVMVGCDLVSHFVEELVISYVDNSSEDSIEHGAHHIHGSSDSVNWLLYQTILLIVIAVTFITSKCIFEGGKISQMMADTDMISVKKKITKSKTGGMLNESNQEAPGFMPVVKSVLHVLVKNPIRLLTLGYSLFLMCLPMLPMSLNESIGFDINELSTLVVAATLCFAGWNLVKTLGGILLISFPYSDYDYNVLRASITDNIHNLPSFKSTYSIDSLFVTKVNYQLYIANVGVTMKGGSTDDESRLLFEVNRILEKSVKDFDADSKVETTISVTRV